MQLIKSLPYALPPPCQLDIDRCIHSLKSVPSWGAAWKAMCKESKNKKAWWECLWANLRKIFSLTVFRAASQPTEHLQEAMPKWTGRLLVLSFFWVIFCKKNTSQLARRVCYVRVNGSVSQWVRDVCMSRQSDWIYYKQPIKNLVLNVNGTWEDLIPIQFRTAIFILL